MPLESRDSELARLMGKTVLAWDRARASLWFIPTVLVFAAIILSTVLLEVDERLGGSLGQGFWLFRGNAEGARVVLSVIAGSLITVLAVAFSGTMIAIQQAATQYTPRVLRNFTKDRGNQWVLGMYISTFAYALLVLRRVRGEDGDLDAIVPSISISAAMLLALLSLGFLIYFIHHVAESLQVSYLLSAIRRELNDEITRLHPQIEGELDPDEHEAARDREAIGHEIEVAFDAEGYLRLIDHERLASSARHRMRLIRVEVGIGEYLRPGDVIVRGFTDNAPGEDFERDMRAAFQVDRDRSVQQDPLFGVRQIVDIAVKALSPGINDPTTAEQALDHLGGVLNTLQTRKLRTTDRVCEDGTVIWCKAPSFEDYVQACFAQIRRAARSNLHVSLHLIGIVRSLLERATRQEHVVPLRNQLDEVVDGFDESALGTRDRALLQHGWRGTR